MTIPPGYVLVPLEATEEMLEAGSQAGVPDVSGGLYYPHNKDELAYAYRAMISKGEGIGSSNASRAAMGPTAHLAPEAEPSGPEGLIVRATNLTAAQPQIPTGRVWSGTISAAAPHAAPLTWQDIRLCAGEGKLSPESILSAANILWGRRFDALSRPDETPAPSAWLPIESAPRDGTYVLLSFPSGRMACGMWCELGEPSWISFRGGRYEGKPTHWQPLPDPPQ